MVKLKEKAQGLTEYVILFCVILAVVLIAQTAIKRAYQGKIRDEMTKIGGQYSPGHTTSKRTMVNRTSTITTTEKGVSKTVLGPQAGYVWTDSTVFEEKVDALTKEKWPN